MIALVAWLILPIKSPGLMLNVVGSMSTNTGRAPSRHTAPAVAKNVKLGITTSSPGPIPSAINGNNSASLPDAQPTACATPQYAATAASNRAHAGPCTNAPDRQTSAIAASSSARSRSFSRETSSIGTPDTGGVLTVALASKADMGAISRANRGPNRRQRVRRNARPRQCRPSAPALNSIRYLAASRATRVSSWCVL